METIIVTRHEALVDYLFDIGALPPVDEGFKKISHATREDIEGNDVIGVLPLSLAQYANTITEVTLNIPQELRGQELTYQQIKEFAGDIVTYKVTKISTLY